MRLDRKASNILMENVMFILIVIFFVALISAFLYTRSNNGAVWEDFYSKEIVRILNSGQAGDFVELDVHEGTGIASKNKLNIQEASNMFYFDAINNKVCVTLTKTGGKCYFYFNEVTVTDVEIKLASPINILSFNIVEKTGVLNG